MIGGVAVLFGWSWMGLEMAHARPQSPPPATMVGIPSVQMGTPYLANSIDSLNPYSISIYKPIVLGSTTVTDVTTTWLPEVTVNGAQTVTGVAVYVVVNNNGSPVIPTSINLKDLNPASSPFSPTNSNSNNPFLNLLTTSHYRGYCTNFGPNTDTGPDFTFNPTQSTLTIDGTSTTVIGYKLTPNDCGGMAVLQTNAATFIVPQDSLPGVPADGIAQVYEALYPAASCKIGHSTVGQSLSSVTADNDCTPTPALNAALGDGISNFDEARGFIVSGAQIRTDWRQKDLFFHVVKASSIPAGSNCYGTYGTSLLPSSLFDNFNNLISEVQIHPLGNNLPDSSTTNEWVDKFSNYEIDLTSSSLPGIFTFSDGTTNPPADDRQINLNALYLTYNSILGSTYQKGLRITECLDNSDTSATPLLGSAGWGPAYGPDNSVVNTQRIKVYTEGQIGSKAPYWDTYDLSGKLTSSAMSDSGDIVTRSIRFYLAMELGHSVRLTPTFDNGYHHAPGAGSNMDQSIVTTSDASSITFHIPTLYIDNDQQNFRLKN